MLSLEDKLAIQLEAPPWNSACSSLLFQWTWSNARKPARDLRKKRWHFLKIGVDKLINQIEGVDNSSFTSDDYIPYYKHPSIILLLNFLSSLFVFFFFFYTLLFYVCLNLLRHDLHQEGNFYCVLCLGRVWQMHYLIFKFIPRFSCGHVESIWFYSNMRASIMEIPPINFDVSYITFS